MIYLIIATLGAAMFGYWAFIRYSTRRAIILACAVSWAGFLIFNTAAEILSPDKAVMTGSWVAIQVIGGCYFSVISVISGFFLSKLWKG